MSDFFMNTKDVWIETKEFGDWRIKDSERAIAEWKQGFVDHKTPDDYPLDKSKIMWVLEDENLKMVEEDIK